MKTTNKSTLKSILYLFIILILSTTLSFAQDHVQTMSPNNLKIFVQYRLIQAHLLQNDNIQVEVSGDKIILADIGHFESEQFTKEIFYELLIKNFPKFAVHLSEVNTNPINYL